jgi:hypothetical protein
MWCAAGWTADGSYVAHGVRTECGRGVVSFVSNRLDVNRRSRNIAHTGSLKRLKDSTHVLPGSMIQKLFHVQGSENSFAP